MQGVSTEGLEEKEEPCIHDTDQCYASKLIWSNSWECSKLKTGPPAEILNSTPNVMT